MLGYGAWPVFVGVPASLAFVVPRWGGHSFGSLTVVLGLGGYLAGGELTLVVVVFGNGGFLSNGRRAGSSFFVSWVVPCFLAVLVPVGVPHDPFCFGAGG